MLIKAGFSHHHAGTTGNQFNVGTEIMRIADLSNMEVQVDVGENDIPKVKLGDTANVTIDAFNNRKFKGVVYKIANPTPSLAESSGASLLDCLFLLLLLATALVVIFAGDLVD